MAESVSGELEGAVKFIFIIAIILGCDTEGVSARGERLERACLTHTKCREWIIVCLANAEAWNCPYSAAKIWPEINKHSGGQ